MLKLSPYTLIMHKEMYKMAYDMQGIQQIIPFSKEIFNISMQLLERRRMRRYGILQRRRAARLWTRNSLDRPGR